MKYIDPDGNDIHNIYLLGIGFKTIAGVGGTWGIAFDSKGTLATFITFNVGVGLEASINTPLNPGYSRSEGVNLSDLKHFGPIAYNKEKGASASAIVGIIYDFDSNKINGVTVGAIGGGVDVGVSVYLDFKESLNILADMSQETRVTMLNVLKDTLPEEIYKKVQDNLE